MLTTRQASAAIQDAVPVLDSEFVAIEKATGRILREPVLAERDQPPFDRVMMDGIALRHTDIAAGQRSFTIQSTQAAGDPALSLNDGHCIEIMTGASLPRNADCIVPVERISISQNSAIIEDSYQVAPKQFIHARGTDYKSDATLLTPGREISPMDIAVIASSGRTSIEVSAIPIISILSTGNELVAAGAPIKDHQVRLSNGPAIASLLEKHGFTDARQEHIPDNQTRLAERISEHLEHSQVLILSGGVSMGKADYVPKVLDSLGVKKVFHKVSQRPGKPMWFGIGSLGQAVFALPGNPVSTLVCCRQYVIPALKRASAKQLEAPEFASLSQDVLFEPPLTCFLPVRIVFGATGQQLALPVHTNTSGDFAALSSTTGYVELPLEESLFNTGSSARLHRWQA